MEGTTKARRGCGRRGGVENAASRPPRHKPSPPSPPLHLQPNGLLRAPYLIPATAAAPAPSRYPPRPRAWKPLRGRPFGQRRGLPSAPGPSPRRFRLASAQPGRRPGSAMGAPSALPLVLILACFWAPGGANLSQDDSQPWTSDETVVAGGTVVLKCQVKDHEDSSLQWSNPAQQTLYFGEKRALRDNRIQLVSSTPHELSISISNVALADEGEYTCSIFTMPVRTAKSLVTVLGIPQKPIITGYKSSLREKETATLNCQSSGSKPAAQLTWRKGDQELHGDQTRVQEDPNGKTFTVSSSVSFQVTREDDGASIVCSVNHESLKGADRSTSQRIEVLYTPTAMIRPEPAHPREGQKLLLHCEGRGNPVPQQYLWVKEGSEPPLKMTQESALIFPFLNKSDSGTYGCTATSNMGSYTAYFTLNVNDPSPVPSSSSTYHAIIGGIVAFIVFLLLILLIFLGHYLIRHKGTYLTHEAKGSDDAPDADTAIINAEGGQSGGDDKKEYFI
ncbi:cell adhesion molecule 3 isoform X2 [Phodopus roborovskii]|uniref:cell adhesion molecule 3 isoform X2 n=1 Tax=Phodopus roborovskii TaxID=109678 RepID=UPI0021E39FA8|nr:cell adhesion molecule 3 isoform X2 [Phodopus roborovskii]